MTNPYETVTDSGEEQLVNLSSEPEDQGFGDDNYLLQEKLTLRIGWEMKLAIVSALILALAAALTLPALL